MRMLAVVACAQKVGELPSNTAAAMPPVSAARRANPQVSLQRDTACAVSASVVAASTALNRLSRKARLPSGARCTHNAPTTVYSG